MKIKKYKYVFFNKLKEEYIIANRRPNNTIAHYFWRYDPYFFTKSKHAPIKHYRKYGSEYTYSEIAIMLLKKFKREYRSALKEVKQYQEMYDNSTQHHENVGIKHALSVAQDAVKSNRKHINIWQKKVNEIKSSKEYLMELLLK